MVEENSERRVAERQGVQANVEFFVDADIINASSVDISASGIKFVTDDPIRVLMRMELDGAMKEFYAQLVWARMQPDGPMSYGLHFIDPPPA